MVTKPPRSISTPAAVESEPVAVGHRTDGQHGVRTVHDPAVVAAHDDRVAVTLDRDRPGTLQQVHAALQEVVLEHRGDLRILQRQHLLAADDERDLGAEAAEHVDELDAGDARSR